MKRRDPKAETMAADGDAGDDRSAPGRGRESGDGDRAGGGDNKGGGGGGNRGHGRGGRSTAGWVADSGGAGLEASAETT